jgi:hypothetical protein
VRIALATLLLLAAAGLAFVPAPGSFMVGALPMLLAFFLGWMRFAVDLVDLVAAELVADLAVPVAVALGFVLGSGSSSWVVVALLVAAAAAQALPRFVRTRSAARQQDDSVRVAT